MDKHEEEIINDIFKEENMIKEPLDEAIPKEVPEAPMSIHIDTYYKGFHAGVTIRMMDNSVIPVSNIMKSVDSLLASGFKPSWNEDTNNAVWTTPVVKPTVQPVAPVVTVAPVSVGTCPKCGSPLVEATKRDGTPYKKCSTNKWNKVTKQATGCDYVDWGN